MRELVPGGLPSDALPAAAKYRRSVPVSATATIRPTSAAVCAKGARSPRLCCGACNGVSVANAWQAPCFIQDGTVINQRRQILVSAGEKLMVVEAITTTAA